MAEAPSNRFPSGHDEEFVHEVEDDFHCLICHLPLKEPVLTRCGHRFCKECLEEHLKRQEVQVQPLTCPADREGLDQDRDVFPDKATGRKILSFAIKCPSEDCDWTGELRNKKVHLETCPSKVVSCTNENCHMTLKRKDLEQHVTITCEWKIIECKYCKEPRPECHMQNHIEKCNKLPLPCPNSCDDSIPREMIPNHIENDCPLTIVSCPYVQMGCIEKVQRKSVSSHLQLTMLEHLDFACAKLNNTQHRLNETQAQLSVTQDQLNNTQETTKSLEEKVTALQKQLEMKGKTESLTQDQLSNTQEITRNLEDQVEALQRQLENNNPRFIWKINKFSEILSQAKAKIKEKIISDPFYTKHYYGYKLQVSVFPNGHSVLTDEEAYLSVRIFIMEGECDAMLPWPFSKKITFTLIDQQVDPEKRENVVHYLSPKENKKFHIFHKRPKGADNPEGTIYHFISHKKLQTRCYLVDDTLFIQVEIGPL